MDQPEPTTKTVTVDEAQQLDDLLRQVAAGGTHVAIEEGGRSVAGLVSAEELELLTRLGPALRDRFQPLLRGWAAFSDESPERIEQEIERAISGSFSDLEWDETVDALDRIRHDGPPTPPIDL